LGNERGAERETISSCLNGRTPFCRELIVEEVSTRADLGGAEVEERGRRGGAVQEAADFAGSVVSYRHVMILSNYNYRV